VLRHCNNIDFKLLKFFCSRFLQEKFLGSTNAHTPWNMHLSATGPRTMRVMSPLVVRLDSAVQLAVHPALCATRLR
jgi:hypothetical protein